MDRPDRERREVLSWGMAAMIGTNLVACLAIGAAIGYGLDRWLGTAPVMIAVWVFAGMAAGFLQLYRTAKRFEGSDRDVC
ncbi:MAG: AtpZ/AtpI family protein [Candidatus Wallbacteria bacterium]|nr:AtpZ/AtpI family protein [Candidatus Wallbacteria bacterium]